MTDISLGLFSVWCTEVPSGVTPQTQPHRAALVISHLFLTNRRFPPSCHLSRWLFLCSCRLLLSKPHPWLLWRVQSCSQPKAAGLTPGLDLILLKQFILVPLTATSSNPAVIFMVLKLSKPLRLSPGAAWSSPWLQTQDSMQEDRHVLCSGEKQLQRYFFFFLSF